MPILTDLQYSEGGWKYKVRDTFVFTVKGMELADEWVEKISFEEPIDAIGAVVKIQRLGVSTFKIYVLSGYGWDGASGPAIDTKTIMAGALGHDVLYQLMRRRVLEPSAHNQRVADEFLQDTCLAGFRSEDGRHVRMSIARATWVFLAVQTFAKRSTLPESEPKMKCIRCANGGKEK